MGNANNGNANSGNSCNGDDEYSHSCADDDLEYSFADLGKGEFYDEGEDLYTTLIGQPIV